MNRFAALVRLADREVRVHVRNSGRLRELLVPDRRVLLEPAGRAGRRTAFTLALIRLGRGYVSVDAHLPNALVEAWVRAGLVPGCRGYRLVRREPALGKRRADLLLARGAACRLVEVKSVTLVRDGLALFPDAPTLRGREHLAHLAAARNAGTEAVVVFVIQRDDAAALAPNRATDPDFATALVRAVRAGVTLRALACRVTRRGVSLAGAVPIRLDARGARGAQCAPRRGESR